MPFPVVRSGATVTAAKPKTFTIPDTCPNALFASWLNEWYRDAATKQSKLQFAYKRALESMLKWPERLRSGRDATKLPGIGPSIAARLQERLVREGGPAVAEEEIEILNLHSSDAEDEAEAEAVEAEAVDAVEAVEAVVDESSFSKTKMKGTTRTRTRRKKSPTNPSATSNSNRNSNSRKKTYIPAYRSAPYGVLIALLLAGGALSKSELAGKAQVFATSSLTDGLVPALGGALRTLEAKGHVGRMGGNVALTKSGAELALRLWQNGEASDSQLPPPQLDPSKLFVADADFDVDVDESWSSKSRLLHEFWWEPGSYELVCLVDVREIRSRDDRCYLSDRLSQMGVSNEVRNLELGDFLWIARKRTFAAAAVAVAVGSIELSNNDELRDSKELRMSNNVRFDSEELVLPVIIERKREDDLCASITDGRFKEQKHRLRSCLLDRPIYLVERPLGSAASTSTVFDAERLLGAALQCQIGDGLQYRQTGGLEESIAFVAAIHRRLQCQYQGRRIRGVSVHVQHFDSAAFRSEFASLSGRGGTDPLHVSSTAFALLNAKTGNQTTTDILCQQLLCIPGLTFAKARHLLGLPHFSSPQAIHCFYEELPGAGGQAQDALAVEEEAAAGAGRDARRFGVALSRRIYNVFGR